MKAFNQKKFNEYILSNNIVGFFPKPIKLVSGRISSWYVNWRIAASDVYLIDQLSDFLLSFVAENKIKFDCIYGTPDGATKLAVISQFKWAQSQPNYAVGKFRLPMGRKQPKDHGSPEDRFFVGAPTGRVVVIEDVTTTGGSLLKTVNTLTETGVKVVATLAITDRNEVTDTGKHVKEILKKQGVKHYAMSQALELLPILVQKKRLSAKDKKVIIDEFKKYGETEIDLN